MNTKTESTTKKENLQIVSKYSMGDTVFFIHDGQVKSGTVRGVSGTYEPPHHHNVLTLVGVKEKSGSVQPMIIDESKCFPSKEELIKSL